MSTISALSKTPQTTYLKDYQPPDFKINTVNLTVYLDCLEQAQDQDSDKKKFTRVISRLNISRSHSNSVPLILYGRALDLLSVKLNNKKLNPDKKEYTLDAAAGELSIHINHFFNALNPLHNFELEIITKIYPEANSSLEGLYKVKNLFCTQCEPQGFRKITYYLDRPDVMAAFTTTIIADKTAYPVLLSNGNLIEQKNLDHNLHSATWQDPFKKPCYLFALAAGDLACIEDEFTTQSQRKIQIKLYVDKGDEDKTAFALASVKKAMRWDEENYGREYDLDIFMIVATHSFNMGAMENKGLNIFNSKYILAKPETATDEDYTAVERVIGHEYFHNWTGNRITCRDWFQLSLKESLTVFRDAQFSADMTSPAVVRINDVNTLRSVQFPQDSGPMAHPVQPKSYIEINNFYTPTVYEKGAEIIRMLHTLLGKKVFRQGMDIYFERHDGQAVRIEEFIQAHADASQKDLSQFMRWYHQAGTPVLKILSDYDSDKQTFVLTLRQTHKSNKAFYFPFKIGLLNPKTGQDIISKILEVKDSEQTFIFKNITEKPALSLLRDFSAPIKIDYDYSDTELAFLWAHDSDPVARWDAGQQLALRMIHHLMKNSQTDCGIFIQAFRKILSAETLDPALTAQLSALPAARYLIEQTDCTADHQMDKLFQARKFLRRTLAQAFQEIGLMRVKTAENSPAGRALKNQCLAYLGLLNAGDFYSPAAAGEVQEIILSQFYHAKNMTDQIAAFAVILHQESLTEREKAVNYFYQQWRHEPLALDKWFSRQAGSESPDALHQVKTLINHPDFNFKNPNKVRALIGAFSQNLPAFHDINYQGYAFLTEQIIVLNQINPMIAARLCEPLLGFRKYDQNRQIRIKSCLEKIKQTPNLAKDIYEIITKSLELDK